MNHLEREREEKLKASQAYGEAVQTHASAMKSQAGVKQSDMCAATAEPLIWRLRRQADMSQLEAFKHRRGSKYWSGPGV